MDDVSIRFVFDKKKQATASKPGILSIEVRQTGTSRRVYISTGIKLYQNQFSPVGGFACRNHPNAALVTSKAHNIYNKVEAFCLSPECASLDDVRGWTGREDPEMRVTDFMRKQLSMLDPSQATLEHTLALIRQAIFNSLSVKSFNFFLFGIFINIFGVTNCFIKMFNFNYFLIVIQSVSKGICYNS